MKKIVILLGCILSIGANAEVYRQTVNPSEYMHTLSLEYEANSTPGKIVRWDRIESNKSFTLKVNEKQIFTSNLKFTLEYLYDVNKGQAVLLKLWNPEDKLSCAKYKVVEYWPVENTVFQTEMFGDCTAPVSYQEDDLLKFRFEKHKTYKYVNQKLNQ